MSAVGSDPLHIADMRFSVANAITDRFGVARNILVGKLF